MGRKHTIRDRGNALRSHPNFLLSPRNGICVLIRVICAAQFCKSKDKDLSSKRAQLLCWDKNAICSYGNSGFPRRLAFIPESAVCRISRPVSFHSNSGEEVCNLGIQSFGDTPVNLCSCWVQIVYRSGGYHYTGYPYTIILGIYTIILGTMDTEVVDLCLVVIIDIQEHGNETKGFHGNAKNRKINTKIK